MMFKVSQFGFFWPKLSKDAFEYCSSFVQCQAALNMKKSDRMPLQPVIEVEIFDLWGMIICNSYINLHDY